MKYLFFGLLLFGYVAIGQNVLRGEANDSIRKSLRETPKEAPKAPHNWYKIYNLKKDTVYVDTSLTINSDYKFNYLRKDNFGLLPFANDGHTYTTLDYSLVRSSALPSIGFKAKHFNYLEANDVKYFSVPTPMTELYFKTVLEQGQSVDAFITLNTSKNLNVSIAYKGLRSLGKYQNSLSSNGNFRFTSSYHTTSKRYGLNAHFTGQDFSNQENGGLLNKEDFESGDAQFDQRSRLEVILTDAKNKLIGKRYFIDHYFRLNKNNVSNNVYLEHQMNYETKKYSFDKETAFNKDIEGFYFGDSFVSSKFSDVTKSNSFYNKLGATFSNSSIGKFNVFVEDIRYNYFYKRIVITNEQVAIPSANNFSVQSFGGTYFYLKNKMRGEATFTKGLSIIDFSTLDISAEYRFNDKNKIAAQYSNINKIPDLNYSLYQSDFVSYNWYNRFKNEKINTFKFKLQSQWLNTEAQFSVYNDYLYFSNDDATNATLITTPKQYAGTINYISVKTAKEFRFRKWSLDNTILYQQVTQDEAVLNVPKLVTRNTLCFSDYVFKKALFLQTGFTFQYFTQYKANGYNPLISEFYTQNTEKIGGFPMFDFFVNGRVRQTRIFLKAEHFNSSFTGNRFYAAPNNPYKDFVIRFGLVWNFFQ